MSHIIQVEVRGIEGECDQMEEEEAREISNVVAVNIKIIEEDEDIKKAKDIKIIDKKKIT